VRADVAFAAAMRRFAGRVLAGALPHPWATLQSPARLAARLVSMVGRTATDEELALAAKIESVAGAILGPVPTVPVAPPAAGLKALGAGSKARAAGSKGSKAPGAGLKALGAGPTAPVAGLKAPVAVPMSEDESLPPVAAPGLPVDASGPLATPAGYAEAIRTATAAATELAAAHEQIQFLAEVIAERDARLAKARKQLNSRTFRLAKSMVKRTRKVVALIRLKRFRKAR
jgi:hypothetical protein